MSATTRRPSFYRGLAGRRRGHGPPLDYVCTIDPSHQGLVTLSRGETMKDYLCGTCRGSIRGRRQSGEVNSDAYAAAIVRPKGIAA